MREFKAKIQAADKGGAFVEIPFDVEKEYGKKRVKIKATIDGEPYQGSLVKYGTPYHMLIILKGIRAKIGKQPGDTVSITLEEDNTPRVVEIPEDVQAKLNEHPREKAFFESMSYTHKKEYIQWITGAKKEETRERRKDKMIELLKAGKKGR